MADEAGAGLILLGLAVLAGVALAAAHMTDRPELPRWTRRAGYVHGALGAAGLIAVLPALAGPGRGVARGAGGFGRLGALLLALALGLGVLILLLALHGMAAIAGFLLLAAYFAMPP
jgi:hypothetical protein